jgi:hypothetical protein
MEILEFNQIEPGMKVLYKIKEDSNEFFTTSVISTSKGHPGINIVRLMGGFEIVYVTENFLVSDKIAIKQLPALLYKDNPQNRTQLLLEDIEIFPNLGED